jgi:hypothetical protein
LYAVSVPVYLEPTFSTAGRDTLAVPRFGPTFFQCVVALATCPLHPACAKTRNTTEETEVAGDVAHASEATPVLTWLAFVATFDGGERVTVVVLFEPTVVVVVVVVAPGIVVVVVVVVVVVDVVEVVVVVWYVAGLKYGFSCAQVNVIAGG